MQKMKLNRASLQGFRWSLDLKLVSSFSVATCGVILKQL